MLTHCDGILCTLPPVRQQFIESLMSMASLQSLSRHQLLCSWLLASLAHIYEVIANDQKLFGLFDPLRCCWERMLSGRFPPKCGHTTIQPSAAFPQASSNTVDLGQRQRETMWTWSTLVTALSTGWLETNSATATALAACRWTDAADRLEWIEAGKRVGLEQDHTSSDSILLG